MTSTNQTSHELTLRMLNGMLSGVEFTLSAPRTLFYVGAAEGNATPSSDDIDVQSQASDTLYIPADSAGPNFSIVGSGENCRGDFGIELFETPVRVLEGRFQHPSTAGALVFAIKPAADEWCDAVLQYNGSTASLAVQAKPEKRRFQRLSGLLILLVSLAVLAAGAWQGWRYLDSSASARNRLSLDAMLQAPNHHFLVRQGRDQVFYVLANDEMDAAWAQQQLARSQFSHPVRVLSLQEEQARIGRWLDERHVNYFILRMPSLDHPCLVLSLERNNRDADSIRALQQAAQAAMPYAGQVELRWQSDALLVADAEARLDKLALVYSRQGDASHGLVYVLKGEIDDGALSQLRQQISEFERSYGERYVRFVLEQREDWLKGKSYKYGVNGYVQLGPRHWYFPKPL